MALAKVSNPATLAVFDAIYQRRAQRNYMARPVSKENVQALLDAAVQAPSAMNRQPWAFLVLQNRDLLRRISEAAKARILASAEWAKDLEHKSIPLSDPNFDIFYRASTLIVICMKEEEGFCPEGDCYLAGQNLMLAAQALGLGSCPIGFARDILQTDAFRKELAIPKGYRPVLPIIVGYASNVATPPHREQARVIQWLQ